MMDLAQIVDPHGAEVFFRDYYEQRHLHIRRGVNGYYDDILTVDDLDAMLTQRNLNPAGLQIVTKGASVPAERWTDTVESLPGPIKSSVNADQVLAFYHQGSTIVLPHAEKTIPRLAAACRAFEQELGIRAQANVYITPPNSQSWVLHYDAHDIFVMQIKGPKNWRLYDTGENLPIVAQRFTSEPRLVEELALETGDFLYLPRGLTHDVYTGETSSVHVNFALKPRYGADMIETLAARARDVPFFRRTVPHPLASPEAHDAYVAEFSAQLAALIEDWPAGRLLEEQRGIVAARQLPAKSGSWSKALRIEALSIDSIVARREDVVITETGEGVPRVVCDGRSLSLPTMVDSVQLLQEAPFRVGDIRGLLSDSGRVELAGSLVRAGLLRIVTF